MPRVLAPLPALHRFAREPLRGDPPLPRMRAARRRVSCLVRRGPGVHLRACPGRSELVRAPKPRILGMSPSEEPEPLGRGMTVFPTGIGVEREVMIDALRNFYARFIEQHGGPPPEGELIYEDFSRDGEVLFFAFAVHTGGGSS